MSGTTTGRRYGVNAGLAIKVPCVTATTANIALAAEQTIDGVAVVENDRVLVKDQSDAVENGVYDVSTGDWRRSPDFDGINDVTEGTLIPVNGGVNNSSTMWKVITSGTIIPGTTSISIVVVSFGLGDTAALNIVDYGADPTGATDSTSAIQDTIDAGESGGRSVFIPAGTYLVSDCLTIETGLKLFGEGMQSVLKVDASVDASTDIICLSPSTTTDDKNTGYILEDFRIEPVSGTPGRYGVSIDITTRALYQSRIKGVRIDQLGNYGIATLPNATPLMDGFFTSTIEECVIYGGIKLDKAGDSLRILRNTLTGTNVGVYVDLWCNTPLVDCFDGGPHGLEIIGNNITCEDGALDVRNAHAGVFSHNVVEVPAGGTLQNSAAISIDGIPTKLTQSFMVINNSYLTTVAGNDVVYFGYCDQCVAKNNYSARVLGSTHYNVSANAVNTRIIDCYAAGGEAKATMLTDAGTSTFWFRTWAGVIDTNQGMNLEQGKEVKIKDSDDEARSILKLETVDDTLKVGFNTTGGTTTEGYLLMYANGVELMRLDPNQVNGGVVIVGQPSFGPGLNPLETAALQVESTTGGIYPPRMTTALRTSITASSFGCIVYDTDANALMVKGVAGWEQVTSAAT